MAGSGFHPSHLKGGGVIEATARYIAGNVVIEKGEIVEYGRTGIKALTQGTDFDDPAFGAAGEAHDGVTAGRQSGTEILVYDNPLTVFKHIPKQLSTTTGGSSTLWTDSSLTAADDVFNGGKVVIVSTNSIAGFNVGDVLSITDFANSGGVCTVSGAGGTIAAGMTGYIYPGFAAITVYGFDLNSDGMMIDLDTAGGESLIIEDVTWDAQLKEATVYCRLRLHQLGNDAAAK